MWLKCDKLGIYFSMYKQLLILVSLSALVACASGESQPDESVTSTSGRGSDCISQGSIRDYTVLDDANLIVSERANRNYHVVLSRRAVGLRSNWRIGFDSHTSKICGGFDSIITDGGFGPETIRIASIRRLTPEEEEVLLVRFGKKEPENEQPRQPEDVEGAEVEELD
jgi:hypothetical protein